MYHLKRNDTAIRTVQLEAKAIGQALQVLRDSSEGLVFEEGSHTYSLAGQVLPSVSEVVKYFAPFDTEKKAAAAAKNPKHPLYGNTAEQIIKIWEAKRDAAADAGTAVHAFAEACCSYMLGRDDEIESQFRCRLTGEGLLAITPKEEAVAKWWSLTDWSRYAIVAKETRVVNAVDRYAGTFDLLLYDRLNSSPGQPWYSLRDYKTNEDLHRWFGDYLQPPLNMIKSNDIGKYTLQQNLYAIQCENIGIHIGDMQLIWLKEDSDFEEVALDTRYQKVIRTQALRQYNNRNKI